MTYFKLPNHIFDFGLKANELVVLAYLCSIRKPEYQDYIVVKHDTIAAACSYATLLLKASLLRWSIIQAFRYNVENTIKDKSGNVTVLGHFEKGDNISERLRKRLITRGGPRAVAEGV